MTPVSSKAKPVRQPVRTAVGTSEPVNVNAVNMSLGQSAQNWADREDARLTRELRADQAHLAITCGVRGGR